MKRQSIVVILISAALLLTFAFLFSRGPGQLDTLRTVGEVLLLVGFVGQLLYGWFHRHSFGFYLFVERIKVRLSRRSAVWDVMVRYAVPWRDAGQPIMDGAEASIRSLAGDQTKVRSLGTWQRLFEWRRTGIHVEVTVHPPEGVVPGTGTPLVDTYVHIGNLRVAFADSQVVLEQRIIPLLEAIEESIRPDDRAYTLRAAFEGGENPYLGLLLHWFPPEYIERFEASLRLLPADQVASAGSVLIERDQVSVTSPARRPFQTAALQCLTLSLARSRTLP